MCFWSAALSPVWGLGLGLTFGVQVFFFGFGVKGLGFGVQEFLKNRGLVLEVSIKGIFSGLDGPEATQPHPLQTWEPHVASL